MCECYQIGGPFIAEDPNCPMHGLDAQAREREAERRAAAARAMVIESEYCIDMVRMRQLVRLMAEMVPGYSE